MPRPAAPRRPDPGATAAGSGASRSDVTAVPLGSEGFVDAVLAVVDDIPPGSVATYGDVAAILGSRGARAVGQVMARYGADVPWWRVVRAGGRPPAGHADRARPRYESEGTPLVATADDDGYRIDIAACHWRP